MSVKEKTLAILREQLIDIARHVVDEQIATMDMTEAQQKASMRDGMENIQHLINAIEMESPLTFSAYIIWLRDVLIGYGFSSSVLSEHLNRIAAYAASHFDKDSSELIASYILEAVRLMKEENSFGTTYIAYCGEHQALAASYLEALIKANRDQAISLILSAVNDGKITIEELYTNVFTNVLYEIGRLWQIRHISVGQEHYSTAVTQYAMSLLYDKIFNHMRKTHKMIGLCVGDELHEIGVRMVCDVFEMRGWDSYYLGANVPTESILSEIDRIGPIVVALSATMANRIPHCADIISAIREAYPSLKVIVGGRAFINDEALWKKIGADGYSKDAVEATRLAEKLVSDHEH